MTAANKLVPANFGQGCFGQAAAIVSAISHPTLVYRMYDCMDTLQQQSKVCIQTFALLYIAAFPCIPNCLGIMDQLITGNYVIKFEKNSFRVQLSARGYSNLLCLGAAEGAGKGR